VTAFDTVVGQHRAVAMLTAAAADAAAVVQGGDGPAMTHAWLLVGPPGSGRSVAAAAFAQALVCADGGCGQCADCHDAAARTHPDITRVESVARFYRIDDVRQLVSQASAAPLRGRWRVIVLEDADRLASQAEDWRPAAVLLKAIEEPAPRTVWVLCAPSVQDVPQTIRSRCRTVVLTTPELADVASLLVQRDGADPALAAFAARAAQAHIGRARRLVHDEDARRRRAEVLAIPSGLIDVHACLVAADNIIESAREETAESIRDRQAEERADVRASFGMGSQGMVAQGASKAIGDLKKVQERYERRVRSDVIDLALQDLLGFYRDVLVVQWGADLALINDDLRPAIDRLATGTSPLSTVQRMEAITSARDVLVGNAAPRLVLEAMFLALRDPAEAS
jgi:DNA polymerase-3 subunit delta'